METYLEITCRFRVGEAMHTLAYFVINRIFKLVRKRKY